MNNEIIITNHNPQDITIRQKDNQLIFINGGGEVIGITDVKVNGNSVVQNNIAYVIVPTKTSELQNNSGFLTSETDPTVPSIVKTISQADINNWNNKQNALVSGSTIKTINNESLLGSGNLNITGTQYTAGSGIDITNDIISNEITSYNDLTDLPSIPTKTSDLINDSDFVNEDDLSEVAFTGSYGSLSDTPIIPDSTSDLINDGTDGTHPFIANYDNSNLKGLGINNGRLSWLNGLALTNVDIANYSDLPTKTSDLTNDGADGIHPFIPNNDNLGVYGLKALTSDGVNLQYIIGQGDTTITLQDKLVSGTNIKTINNTSILGSGNINISGGGNTDVQINGTSIVNNDVANIITESAYNSSTNKIATKSDIPTTTSQLTNNSNFVASNSNNSFSGTQTFNDITINGNITSSKLVQIYTTGTTTTTATINLPTGIYIVAGYVQAGGKALLPGTTMIMVASGGGVASDIIASGNFTVSIDSSNNCNITATYGNVINYTIVKLL